MRITTKLAGMSLALAALATTACTTDPVTGEKKMSKAAIGALGGAALGTGLGALVGGHNNRTEMIVGAGIGAIAGTAVGGYMDKQERELRQKTAGTGVEVSRQGDEILLNIPSGITFATNSYTIEPQFRSTLDSVAQTLASYNQTYVDVYGHTDSTGNDTINIPLSQNRAKSVADYLTTRGVTSARIGTQGFGASQPIASNSTVEGRAQNRRVEIKIVPVTDTSTNG
ncbi:Outer membrane protein OmpA [Sphingomonas laterariae]|uniref:Outer membrane protein OmpA n=1 Tax=Edaphosphingomonas laterariae TaxID=861865 RepID=A0A239CF79_9SPHN|nr:OmpA family protein [Sphingomonas laterariae]SNS18760.1 Outer membrane protein OmpA [Sphingomonas laterariae]